MQKEQVYELRSLFEQILSDYRDDVSQNCRAKKIQDSVKKGLEICNDDIMKKEPLKIKKTNKNMKTVTFKVVDWLPCNKETAQNRTP